MPSDLARIPILEVEQLDDVGRLRPRSRTALQEEALAIQTRHKTIDDAMGSVRALRRREMLRTAMAAVLEAVAGLVAEADEALVGPQVEARTETVGAAPG